MKDADYFNNGVLLMNLKILRNEEETIRAGMKFFANNPQHVKWPDQDLWNYCFAARSVTLPSKFNCIVQFTSSTRKKAIDKRIYHYVGGASALDLNMSEQFNCLWFKYFVKTPWFNEDAVGRLYEGFLKVRNDLQTRMAKVSAIISGKTRAFFVEPARIDSMKKFFLIRDDEEIIPAENEDSLQKLVDAMRASQGKCVFFIMTPKFLNKNFPFDLLTKEGFALDKDFVRGWEILSDAYGNPFNSYPLIQAM